MTYTPINWQTGDTITAEKMNKMDNGWGVESTQLFSETVTTVASPYGNEAQLAYSQIISNDEIVVTFDGTDYVCQNRDTSTPNSNFFGGVDSGGNYDFSTYPFAIVSVLGPGNIVATETAGTHSIAAETQSVDVSQGFEMAVSVCADTSTMPMECVSQTTTFDDMAQAFSDGRILFFKPSASATIMYIIVGFTTSTVTFIPSDASITATFTNGVFTVTS